MSKYEYKNLTIDMSEELLADASSIFGLDLVTLFYKLAERYYNLHMETLETVSMRFKIINLKTSNVGFTVTLEKKII